MSKRKIVIDLATIYPGKGGAGAGIWNYAKNLIIHLDAHHEIKNTVKCICLVNKEFNLQLKNIEVKTVPFEPANFLFRFLYVHFYLPLYVLSKKASLHKVYFEVPIWTPFKTIVTIHDLMERFYETKRYRSYSISQKIKSSYFDIVTKKAIKRSRLICTPTQFVKQEIVKNYNIKSEKVVVTPLASSKFQFFGNTTVQHKRPIDLYCIAAFHPHKGHFRLIEIFETLCEYSSLDIRLYLRGHVPDKIFFQQIEEVIQRSKFRNRMFILDYQVSSSVEDIYLTADWVILLSEYEGFGLPVIEAQANGIPVICSSIPTFKEAAENSAFYLDDKLNKLDAAKLLENLFSDARQKICFIEKGLENAKRYSWDKLAHQMVALYNSLN